MKCYLVGGTNTPSTITIFSSKKGKMVDVNRPISCLLFAGTEKGKRFADDWAKITNQIVYEIELNV